MCRLLRRELLIVLLILAFPGCTKQAIPAFDDARAFEDIKAQVAIGPRAPGTPGHEKGLEWIVGRLKEAGAEPVVQAFPDTVYGQAYQMSNVRARFGPPGAGWIVIGAHWDTRPYADMDSVPARRTQPVPGANDGGSGVAVLLELARVFRASPPPVGVELVFFDGEDLGKGGDVMGFCRGSRYYVKNLVHPLPSLAIVLDMVGDKDLQLYYEANSYRVAPNLVQRLWAGAPKVNAPAWIAQERHNVYDDHVPFIEGGIPGIDVIDFDYKAWHTTGDDITQVSAQSLGQVGRTVLYYIYTSEPEGQQGY